MEGLGVVHKSFWQGKNVFVTGHTGFKGTWLVKMLQLLGANITGYSLPSPTTEGEKFYLEAVGNDISSVTGDVCDFEALMGAFDMSSPEIVFHLAAQPIVLEGYREPRRTYEVNVMGTVNLLECVRRSDRVCSVVNVTTDKVYENKEWDWGYRENDRLNGRDPYSNSKSCSDIITDSYNKSFLSEMGIAVSTMRAGNVIGGGDFSPNRIVPDCVRAALSSSKIQVRNPQSIRPYQHVLEPLYAYLMLAEGQFRDKSLCGAYNIGPRDEDAITTGQLADLFCEVWGQGLSWEDKSENSKREANLLKLDCSKLSTVFSWRPLWSVRQAVEHTVEWAKVYGKQGSLKEITEKQIVDYLKGKTCDESAGYAR